MNKYHVLSEMVGPEHIDRHHATADGKTTRCGGAHDEFDQSPRNSACSFPLPDNSIGKPYECAVCRHLIAEERVGEVQT